MPKTKTVYQLKVTLKGTKPPIWRRIVVPDNITLYQLHDILQIAIGWTDSHLHMFTIAGQIYGDPEDDEYGDFGTKSELRYRLSQLGLREKARFSYEYDFGDSWDHTILVEKVLPAEKGVHYPVCTAGKRACPPEDVGGVWGYQGFLELLADPHHEDHVDTLEWSGGDFHPDAFDLEGVNETLRLWKPSHARRPVATDFDDDDDDMLLDADDDFTLVDTAEEAHMKRLVAWVQSLTPQQVDAFEKLPLRLDTLVLIEYLSKNRTIGTQSTGNLPLKAVRAICEQFASPPPMDTTIGGHTFKVRSEDDVWPLLFVHQLAFFSNLVTGGRSQTWKVTSEGQMYHQVLPSVQIFLLFFNWFAQVDWAIALPVMGLAGILPMDFKDRTLNCLCEMPVGETVPYPAFVERMMTHCGWVGPAKDLDLARVILDPVIESLVVEPMAAFGVLEAKYGAKKVLRHEPRQLISVCLTPAGKGMLELLR